MIASVHFSSLSVDWPTPAKLYAALDAEFGFTLDPCPLGGGADGLKKSWAGERVYCNPPYGPAIGAWLAKRHEPDVAVYLLPARTDTAWFHEQVLPDAREIRFLRGRLKFGDRPRMRAPFPSMAVIFMSGPRGDR